MFDRFIRLARARKALQEKRFEDALQLADDPLIRRTRRAEDVRSKARAALLERADQRLDAGDLRAAGAIHQRLRAHADDAAVQSLARRLEAGEAAARENDVAAQKGAERARDLVGKGELVAAQAALTAMPGGAPRDGLEQQLAERQRHAAEQLQVVERHLKKGQVDDAWQAYARAAALDRDAAATAEVRDRLRDATASAAADRLLLHVRNDDLESAFAELGRLRVALGGTDRSRRGAATLAGLLATASDEAEPDAATTADPVGEAAKAVVHGDDAGPAALDTPAPEPESPLDSEPVFAELAPLKKPLAKLEAAVLSQLRQATAIAPVARLADAAQRAGFVPAEPTQNLLQAARRAAPAGGGIATADAAAIVALRDAARAAGCKKLAAAVDRRAEQQDDLGKKVEEARELMAGGDLDSARERLTEVLAQEPLHESARRELEIVEQGLGELGSRLAAARAAAKAGRLGEACSLALALGSSGGLGKEAQLLLTDVRARMALVDRGLDEVRATLHGKAAGSAQGVQHCLARLEELRKVQVDHEELTRVITAVETEIGGLQACDRAAAALDRSELETVRTAVAEIVAQRGDLLVPERLDARLLTLADRCQRHGERALAGGRGQDLDRCAAVLEQLGVVGSDFTATVGRWRAEAQDRAAQAAAKVAAAQERLSERDLAAADELFDAAQGLWAEAPQVRAFEDQLGTVRRQHDAIEEVAALTEDRDYQGAQARLAAMPPTPALLRTRIFDMKQQLARAQGLEGAFLMRVDEGGEHLVLRGETVSIGNLRQNRADLPVLANIAGTHATIRRSMSFHGGMEDQVVAEDGEVRVAGRKVRKHKLSSGDKLEFGPSLTAVYAQPTRRSLTAGLTLQGGFQVGGTERILLMKDRGKDGRILLGPSRDVHVRVGSATAEVEVFAASNGQIRVACAEGGTIDGNPFKGEHPVDAGQVVTAGGISFVLLPWRP
ncbi:MAG: hypothetical protein NXI31_03430 [bacterium]|nr:hypothetical protein [bacterium]